MINRHIETHVELVEETICDACGNHIYGEAPLQRLIYRNNTQFLVQVSAINNPRPNLCKDCFKAMLHEVIDTTY